MPRCSACSAFNSRRATSTITAPTSKAVGTALGQCTDVLARVLVKSASHATATGIDPITVTAGSTSRCDQRVCNRIATAMQANASANTAAAAPCVHKSRKMKTTPPT
jgi:hypothetical protein